MPNNEGSLYTFTNSQTLPASLKLNAQIKIALSAANAAQMHKFTLYAEPLVEVQAQITTGKDGPANSIITICNNSEYPIPIKSMELDFTYAGEITSTWGKPWLDWKIQREGN